MSERARQATSKLKIEELKSDDGVKNIFTKLDRIFLQDKNWRCFNAYLSFETFRKTEKQSMDEFLSEFDLRHFKLKECGVKLPDAIVACRLIKSCNLGEMQFQLALSTVPNMTFEDMRMTLKKLFSDIGVVGAVSKNIENKLAEVKVDIVMKKVLYWHQIIEATDFTVEVDFVVYDKGMEILMILD